MSKKQFEWVQETPKSLVFLWKGLPFNHSLTLVWRNIELPIKIVCEKIEFGETRLITFIHEEKAYPCRITKYKWSGGGNGIYPPKVNTSKHHLKITTGIDFIRFEDELIDPPITDDNDEVVPFIVKGAANKSLFHTPFDANSCYCPFRDSDTNYNSLKLYYHNDDKKTVEIICYSHESIFEISYYDSTKPEREDESILIDKNDLEKLCHRFNMYNTSEAELLVVLQNKFSAKDYYADFKRFLKRENIPFSVEHG